jgi:hypothetical protein
MLIENYLYTEIQIFKGGCFHLFKYSNKPNHSPHWFWCACGWDPLLNVYSLGGVVQCR